MLFCIYAEPALVLEQLMNYARAFSHRIGYVFHPGSIRLTALTGSAATEIKGETTAREFDIMGKKEITPEKMALKIEEFADTRLCIIDEISFAGYKQYLVKLNENLKRYTEDTALYGRVAIAFLGDFCQLESLAGDLIYDKPQSIYWEQALTSMVELEGTHRYSQCEIMTSIMPPLRNGGITEEIRNMFNSRVVDGIKVVLPNTTSLKFATFSNKKKCEYNTAVFLNYLQEFHHLENNSNIPKSGIIVKGGLSWATSKQKLSFGQRKVVFENCSDADVKDVYHKRCDPMLKLFTGCQMMVNSNDDVKNGIANGTCCLFKQIIFKKGKTPHPMKLYGYWVYGINAEDVDYVILQWEESHFQGHFKVKPKLHTYQVAYPMKEGGRNMKIKTKISVLQLPVLLNHATTVHKLQGKTIEVLVVAEWNRAKNWAYVVLSRVRSLSGLYLMLPLPADIDFSPRPEYLTMMERLRSKILRTPKDEFVRELHEKFAFP